MMQRIEDKVNQGERLSFEDGVYLFKEANLIDLGILANKVNLQKNGTEVLYNINRHINPTNVCVMTCKFCAYSKKPGQEGAYEYSIDQILEKAGQAVDSGATEIHMVGGLHPRWKFDYYLQMLSAIRDKYPKLHIKGFTAVEINWLSKKARLTIPETLNKLREAGLGSMPGGGAEIFHQDVRDQICAKLTDHEWLDIHRTAHKMGMRTNCTMLYGHVETIEHRVDHLVKLRALQDETNGFNVFIPLAFQPHQNEMGIKRYTFGTDDLRTIAVSRLLLDNFKNIKAYWIMLGQDIAQLSTQFGANDLDGTVAEEKISRAAGGRAGMIMDRSSLHNIIHKADRSAQERGTLYNRIGECLASEVKGLSLEETKSQFELLKDSLEITGANWAEKKSNQVIQLIEKGDFLYLAQKSSEKRKTGFNDKTSLSFVLSLSLAQGKGNHEYLNWIQEKSRKYLNEEYSGPKPTGVALNLSKLKHQSTDFTFEKLLRLCQEISSLEGYNYEISLIGMKHLSYLLQHSSQPIESCLKHLKEAGVCLIESAFKESESGMTNSETEELYIQIHEQGIHVVGKAELHFPGKGQPLWAGYLKNLSQMQTSWEKGLLKSVIIAATGFGEISPVEYFRALIFARLTLPAKISITTPILAIPVLSPTAGIGSLETQHPQEKIAAIGQCLGANDLGSVPIQKVVGTDILDQLSANLLSPQIRTSAFELL